MKSGVELIAIERQEQIEKHGRTINRDAHENQDMQLSFASSFLCTDYPMGCLEVEDIIEGHIPKGWDKNIWKKMVNKTYKERLIIAGALIAAEIDRIQYDDLIT